MITWKREKKSGDHFGLFEQRRVARVIRLGGSAWRWAYRGPREVRTTVDEARMLRHAKQAVEALHATKYPKEAEKHGNDRAPILKASGGSDEGRRADERSRQETDAGHGFGRSDSAPVPSGGGDQERQGPPLWGQPLEVESTPKTVCDFQDGECPSIAGREPGEERVERPNPVAPRGMVPGETPGQALSSLEKHPATLRLFDALMANQGAADA